MDLFDHSCLILNANAVGGYPFQFTLRLLYSKCCPYVRGKIITPERLFSSHSSGLHFLKSQGTVSIADEAERVRLSVVKNGVRIVFPYRPSETGIFQFLKNMPQSEQNYMGLFNKSILFQVEILIVTGCWPFSVVSVETGYV